MKLYQHALKTACLSLFTAFSITTAGIASAADTIKVGILHSLSGTMAISETTLKDTMLMLIDEQNKKGGLLGKQLEPVVVDPASNWPLFAEKARELINSIVAEPEVGRIYKGKVVKIMDFGAFVNFFGKRDGLVHVSQMTFERGANPKDLVKEGQEVRVKLMGFDDRGKVRLSMKVVDQETGQEIKRESADAES